jgi:hypothetical protein
MNIELSTAQFDRYAMEMEADGYTLSHLGGRQVTPAVSHFRVFCYSNSLPQPTYLKCLFNDLHYAILCDYAILNSNSKTFVCFIKVSENITLRLKKICHRVTEEFSVSRTNAQWNVFNFWLDEHKLIFLRSNNTDELELVFEDKCANTKKLNNNNLPDIQYLS